MNMTYEDAMYWLAANEMIGDKIINAVKKFFKENGEMICAGLAAMNGQLYVPSNR